jgi:hypothetical protein
MSIDTFGDKKIRIQDLMLHEPGKKIELPFDPRRDVPDVVWDRVKDFFTFATINIHEGEITPGMLPIMTSNAKLVAGEEADRIPQIDRVQWELIDKTLDKLNREEGWYSYLHILNAVKNADPERGEDSRYNTDEITDQKIKDHVNGLSDDQARDYLSIVAAYNTLNPEKKIHVSDEKWKSIKNSAFFQRGEFFWLNTYQSAETLANVKLIDPKKIDHLDIPEIPWDRLKGDMSDQLRAQSSFGVYTYMLLASRMLILEAEEIKLTENGMELKMPGAAKEIHKEASVPEVRKF